jgi:lysophospholipase L1-like esterase
VKYQLSNFKVNVDSRWGDMTYFNHADFVFHDTDKLSLDWIESATFRKTPDGWKMNFLHLTVRKDIRYDSIRYAKEHYDKRVNLFNREGLTKGRVIFLGNSLTEYADWKQLLADPTVINRGIAGDNSFGVLDRLSDVIVRQPNKVFIEIGINDISQDIPVEIIVQNVFAIVAAIQTQSPATKIYVHSILPTNDNVKKEYPEAYHKNAQAAAVNGQLEQNASEKNFTYIDLSSKVKDKDGQLDWKYAAPDGLHLNKAGYAVWVKLLKEKKYL